MRLERAGLAFVLDLAGTVAAVFITAPLIGEFDFSGYIALFALGVTEAGCMAHARRKFVELTYRQQELHRRDCNRLRGPAAIERKVKDLKLDDRLAERRRRSKPIANTWHEWMIQQRIRATHCTALARALDYSLNRWDALLRYIDDPALPIDNTMTNGRFGRGPRAERIGCLPVHCWPGSVRLRS